MTRKHPATSRELAHAIRTMDYKSLEAATKAIDRFVEARVAAPEIVVSGRCCVHGPTHCGGLK